MKTRADYKHNIHLFTVMYRVLLYLIPFSAIFVVLILLLFKKYNMLLLASYAVVPMIIAPLMYKYTKINHIEIPESMSGSTSNLSKVGLLLYFVLLGLSILVLHFYPVRTYEYYTLITTMYLIILIEILDNTRTPKIILSQILLTHLNLIWGATLKYCYFFGRTDIFPHASWIGSLIETGHITEVFGVYQHFPLWHILIAQVSLLAHLNLEPYKIMFLVNGVIYMNLILFSFLLARMVTKNMQMVLLVTFIVSIYPDVLIYGMYSIPRSAAIFLAVFSLYLMIKGEQCNYQNDIKWIFITILVLISLVVYHTVSVPFFLVVLVVLQIFQWIYQGRASKSLSNYITILMVITAAYWIYVGKIVFGSVVKNFVNFINAWDISWDVYFSQGASNSSLLSEIFNYLQYSFFLFLIILGILYIMDINSKHRNANITARFAVFGIVGLVSTILSMPGPLMVLENFLYNLRITRAGSYLFIFIAFASASGAYYLANLNRMKFLRLSSVFLMVLLVFFSISNDFTASDNPLIKRQIYTWYFTPNEIISFRALNGISVGDIMVDRPAIKYFSFSLSSRNVTIIQIDHSGKLLKRESDLVVLRISEIHRKRGLAVYLTDNFRERPLVSSRKYIRYIYLDRKTIGYYFISEGVIYSSKDVIGIK